MTSNICIVKVAATLTPALSERLLERLDCPFNPGEWNCCGLGQFLGVERELRVAGHAVTLVTF